MMKILPSINKTICSYERYNTIHINSYYRNYLEKAGSRIGAFFDHLIIVLVSLSEFATILYCSAISNI